jgi:hypothetical protein
MCDPTRPKAYTQFRSLFCSFVLDPDLTLGQVISTDWIAELVAQHVGKTCDRIFTPLVTLALFLSQVLSDDQCCRKAVAMSRHPGIQVVEEVRSNPKIGGDCPSFASSAEQNEIVRVS